MVVQDTKQAASRFEDLVVWQKAHGLALSVYRLTADFPKSEIYGLVSQMRRAAVSVPANIVEGFHRRGSVEKVRFFNIAQGSLEELRYLVRLAADLQYGEEPSLREDIDLTGRLLGGYIRGVERRRSPSFRSPGSQLPSPSS